MARSPAAPAFALLVAALLLAAAPRSEAAISCGTVTSYISPCVNYIQGKGPLTTACCNGVKSLNSAAKTTPDRQQACACLKSAAGKISGLNPGLAAGLPGKCGVNLPYPISLTTDCSKVS